MAAVNSIRDSSRGYVGGCHRVVCLYIFVSRISLPHMAQQPVDARLGGVSILLSGSKSRLASQRGAEMVTFFVGATWRGGRVGVSTVFERQWIAQRRECV